MLRFYMNTLNTSRIKCINSSRSYNYTTFDITGKCGAKETSYKGMCIKVFMFAHVQYIAKYRTGISAVNGEYSQSCGK